MLPQLTPISLGLPIFRKWEGEANTLKSNKNDGGNSIRANEKTCRSIRFVHMAPVCCAVGLVIFCIEGSQSRVSCERRRRYGTKANIGRINSTETSLVPRLHEIVSNCQTQIGITYRCVVYFPLVVSWGQLTNNNHSIDTKVRVSLLRRAIRYTNNFSVDRP